MMGGVRVEPETQMSTVPGLSGFGYGAAGLHGANGLGGNWLSDLVVFGKRAGEAAAQFAVQRGPGRIDADAVEAVVREALAPFDRAAAGKGEGPFQVQADLQHAMQDLVGIVRREDEKRRAPAKKPELQTRGGGGGAPPQTRG